MTLNVTWSELWIINKALKEEQKKLTGHCVMYPYDKNGERLNNIKDIISIDTKIANLIYKDVDKNDK